MRHARFFSCVALLLATACTEPITRPDAQEVGDVAEPPPTMWYQSTTETGLDGSSGGEFVIAGGEHRALEAAALSAEELADLVAALFPEPGLSTAATVQLRNILRDIERGNDADALLKAQDFRDFTLQRYETGQLVDPNGSEPPTLAQAVASVLNGVFEAVGVPGGQTLGISRIVYGEPLIDAVAPGEFPRGGSYTATVSGAGIETATGIVVDDPNVFAFVTGSPGPDQLTVRLFSVAVERDRPDLAEILDVPYQITTELDGGALLVVGGGTLDIVPGPAPIASNLRIVGPTTTLPRGEATPIDFAVDIESAGNIRFFFVGCALCSVQFGGFTGDQFGGELRVTVTWDVPADYGWPEFGLGVGAVSGADLVGGTGLSVPVVDP